MKYNTLYQNNFFGSIVRGLSPLTKKTTRFTHNLILPDIKIIPNCSFQNLRVCFSYPQKIA